MKTLRITTHWTTEEADGIYQLLDEFKSVLWDHYGEDIVEMYKAINNEQQNKCSDEFDDDCPF